MQFEALAAARTWRCNSPWVASAQSTGLFEMEYFRHLRQEDRADLSAAGFVKMAGDETDALIITIFMRDLSAEYGIRVAMKDEDHPLAKLRRLEFHGGRLPTGQSLEDVLAKRPVIIEDHVWIGPNATILKGVRIGEGAFIEPGSLITRDVPPRARVLGNPAQIIGEVA